MGKVDLNEVGEGGISRGSDVEMAPQIAGLGAWEETILMILIKSTTKPYVKCLNLGACDFETNTAQRLHR